MDRRYTIRGSSLKRYILLRGCLRFVGVLILYPAPFRKASAPINGPPGLRNRAVSSFKWALRLLPSTCNAPESCVDTGEHNQAADFAYQ